MVSKRSNVVVTSEIRCCDWRSKVTYTGRYRGITETLFHSRVPILAPSNVRGGGL